MVLVRQLLLKFRHHDQTYERDDVYDHGVPYQHSMQLNRAVMMSIPCEGLQPFYLFVMDRLRMLFRLPQFHAIQANVCVCVKKYYKKKINKIVIINLMQPVVAIAVVVVSRYYAIVISFHFIFTFRHNYEMINLY